MSMRLMVGMCAISMHQRRHIVEVHLNQQRVLRDQQTFHRLDARPHHRARGPRIAIAGQAAIGVDPDKAIAGEIADRHGANVRDLHAIHILW